MFQGYVGKFLELFKVSPRCCWFNQSTQSGEGISSWQKNCVWKLEPTTKVNRKFQSSTVFILSNCRGMWCQKRVQPLNEPTARTHFILIKYMYPNLLDPTNFSGPNANPGFPRDVGETPGFFRKITGLEEKPGFFPICWKFRPMITDDLEE